MCKVSLIFNDCECTLRNRVTHTTLPHTYVRTFSRPFYRLLDPGLAQSQQTARTNGHKGATRIFDMYLTQWCGAVVYVCMRSCAHVCTYLYVKFHCSGKSSSNFIKLYIRLAPIRPDPFSSPLTSHTISWPIQALQLYVEKVVVFTQANPVKDLGPECSAILADYAGLLASQGRLDVAATYLKGCQYLHTFFF